MSGKLIDSITLMLTRRRYGDIGPINTSLPNIASFTAQRNDDTTDSYFVVIVSKTKVTIDILKKILTISGASKQIVIVYEIALTPDAKQAIEINRTITFQTFCFDELMYDPILVAPKHYLVTEPCKEWNKYPVLLSTDVIAKYYHFKRGDIVAVEESPHVLIYRRCV